MDTATTTGITADMIMGMEDTTMVMTMDKIMLMITATLVRAVVGGNKIRNPESVTLIWTNCEVR